MMDVLRTSILLTVLFSAALAASFKNDILSQWNLYKLDFNKNYATVQEDSMRMANFRKTLKVIEEHNEKYKKGEVGYEMSLNNFSDWTEEEKKKLKGFKKRKGLNRRHRAEVFESTLDTSELPDSVNWVKRGAVTDIKDQGSCGSCWAFSTVGSLEGQMILKHNKTGSLSTQNLIDCSWLYGNDGCNGGLMVLGFEYVLHNPGIDTDDSYPYEAKEVDCRFKESAIGGRLNGYVEIPSQDEESLKKAVATVGPVSVAIDVEDAFMAYGGGVFNTTDCENSEGELNHAVLVVGYETKSPEGPYWLVKNSWGLKWGERGYVRMAMGVNLCGIATLAVYPKV